MAFFEGKEMTGGYGGPDIKLHVPLMLIEERLLQS